jgi:hypothetical protein
MYEMNSMLREIGRKSPKVDSGILAVRIYARLPPKSRLSAILLLGGTSPRFDES